MPTSLRVATFNIHHGEGKDGVVDIQRTADFIKGLEADLIALQEVDVDARRSKRVDQAAVLADLLGMHLYFAPAMKLDQGEYGIALAAREEFRSAAQPLPRVGKEEPRSAIIASWRTIGVIATHLSRDSTARELQTEELGAIAGRLGTPCVVLGDLNQRRVHLKPLTGVGFSAAKPRQGLKSLGSRGGLDHILVSPGLTVTSAAEHPTVVSDHPAIVAELTRGT
jgi:endonuclease/exonuclease/phosphatase family metal-dependent hydrolase